MKETLRSKQVLSWLYLILGIGLFVLTFIPSFQVSVYSGIVTDKPDYFLVLWVCGILCFVHWIFGAFYYPQKYRRHLAMEVEFTYNEQSRCDLSGARGYIASLSLLVACVMLGFSGVDKLESMLIFIISVSIFIFSFATRTNYLFKPGKVGFDKGALLGGESNEKKQIKYLYFLYPKGEDENLWSNKVAVKYLNDERKRSADSIRKEAEEEKKIQARTEEIRKLIG